MEVMNFLNEIAARYPAAISFAPGRPPESQFDVAESLRYLSTYVASVAARQQQPEEAIYAGIGQYGRTNGRIGDLIARMLRNDDGIAVETEDIVVTVGCQEAMCLALLALCGNPDDIALVADPAYIGISGAARMLGIGVAPVAGDAQGIDLEGLERTVAQLRSAGKQPRLLYFSPDFSNPTGITTTRARRLELIALTRRLGLVVLEDHAYRYFQYDGAPLPALSCEEDADHVIYLGSFSKSIYPGLRIGFLATTMRVRRASGETSRLTADLSKIKSLLTVNSSPLCEAIVGGLLLHHDCSLTRYVESRRLALKANRDAMLRALETYFRTGAPWNDAVRWNTPAGGFFLTLHLPFALSGDDLTVSARDYGVLWTPMNFFRIEPGECREIRLSFSYATAEQIDRGIAALARMVADRLNAMPAI